MKDFSDINVALSAVGSPETTAADLAQLAHAQPSLWALIAAHPHAYPDLLRWLADNGDAATKAVALGRLASLAPSATAPQVDLGSTTPDTTTQSAGITATMLGTAAPLIDAPDAQTDALPSVDASAAQPALTPTVAPGQSDAWSGGTSSLAFDQGTPPASNALASTTPGMPHVTTAKAKRRLVTIIVGVVALALVISGLTWALLGGRRGASNPQAAVTGLMSAALNGKVSLGNVAKGLYQYMPPSELDLFDAQQLYGMFTEKNTTQARLIGDVNNVLGHINAKVSNIVTSVEMIDKGLARVSVTDFTLDVKWDVPGMQKDLRKLLDDVVAIGGQLSATVTSDYDDLSGNWIAASILYQFSYWYDDQVRGGTCTAPPGYDPDQGYLNEDQVLSDQVLSCLATQGPVWLDQQVRQSMSENNIGFPFSLQGLIRSGNIDGGIMQSFTQAAGPFVMAVQEGGRWYVSPMMTMGEYSLCNTYSWLNDADDYCLPATADLPTWASKFGESTDATQWLSGARQPMPTGNGHVSATPEAAVQTTLDSFSSLPPANVNATAWYAAARDLADTMPPAERRFYGTYPSFLSGVGGMNSAITGSFSVASTSGKQAIVRVDQLDVGASYGYGTGQMTIHDGDCFNFDLGDVCLDSAFDPTVLSQYGDSGLTYNISLFRQAAAAFQAASPVSQIGLVTVRNGGGWQFSPMGTAWYLSKWTLAGSLAAFDAIVTMR